MNCAKTSKPPGVLKKLAWSLPWLTRYPLWRSWECLRRIVDGTGPRHSLALLVLLPLGVDLPACAGPLTPGDLLISDGSQHAIYEYTPDGRRVQTIIIPTTTRYNRGVAVDDAGDIHVYNGTFTPTLSTYDPTTGAWVHHSYPGWSTNSD